jgi:flagellar motor switch protein FliN/FliY
MSVEMVSVIELPELVSVATRKDSRVGTRIDLVEHLAVQVTVLAGTAELPAAELFSLGCGDVLPLTESVDQPVELLANGKPIARGVLVAAGDQLGVRITEIVPA